MHGATTRGGTAVCASLQGRRAKQGCGPLPWKVPGRPVASSSFWLPWSQIGESSGGGDRFSLSRGPVGRSDLWGDTLAHIGSKLR